MTARWKKFSAHLYVRDKVARGLRDVQQGRTISQEAMEQRVGRWQKIEWAKSAVEDLNSIVSFIARDSAFYAKKFEASVVLEVRQRLKSFPTSGGVVREFDDTAIREVLHGTYRIIYLVRNDTCYVVAVVHGSRDLGRRLASRYADVTIQAGVAASPRVSFGIYVHFSSESDSPVPGVAAHGSKTRSTTADKRRAGPILVSMVSTEIRNSEVISYKSRPDPVSVTFRFT